MKHYLFLLVFVLFGFQNVYGEEPKKQNFKETLSDFIKEAKKKNPELREAKTRINVFKEIPPQAGSLKDPQLMFGLANLPVDSFSFSQEAMTQKQIQVSQKFPFPGTLKLRVKAADQDVNIAKANHEDLVLKVIREVKTSFYELCYINSTIETTQQNKILLAQFITIAEGKYSVGKGIQQDVLKAQVELSKIMDELIELNQLKQAETGKLNVLMNRLPQAKLNIPHGLAQSPFKFKLEELQKMAETKRPFLKAIKSSIEKFKIKKLLAEKKYYPDFNVGFKYGQREDSLIDSHPDFVSAFVSINIPIWHKTKQSRKVLEENFRIQAFREGYDKAKNQVYLAIKIALDQEAKSSKLIKLIKTGIIPQARQSLESALAAYSVDKVDFLTLIDNQVTLLKWEIKYHRELTDYEQNLAMLENLVGKELF